MKFKQLSIVLILAALAGCSAKKQAVQEPVKEPVVQEPAKQPFTEVTPAAPAPETTGSQYVGSKGAVQSVWGWRVQIFASATLENARKVAEEARWRFSEHQVFILEQGGLHKVQVGNGLGRVQADQLKQRAKEQGFPGAFAIEVTFE